MVIFNSYVKLPEGIPFISHSYPIMSHWKKSCWVHWKLSNFLWEGADFSPIFNLWEVSPERCSNHLLGLFLHFGPEHSKKKLKSVLVIHVVIPVLYAKVAFLGYDFWTTRLFPIVTYMLGPNQTKIAVWFSIEKGLDAPCCRDYIDCNPKKRIERSSGWWLSPTPLKNDEVRQLGWWNSPIVGEK